MAKPKRKAPAWFIVLTACYGASLAAVTALNHFGADLWWFGALNLYLPQAMWLIPGILLILCSLAIAPRWLWLQTLYVIWVLGPVMGLSWSFHPLYEAPGTAALRLMTCNAKFGRHDIKVLIGEIDRQKPDIVLLQDAPGSMKSPLGAYFRKWYARSFGQYVVASRFPLEKVEAREISLPWQKLACLRCQIRLGRQTLTVYNVHFESPRVGLNAFRTARHSPWYLPKAILRLENNVEDRVAQAAAMRDFIRREEGPVIVAGDLNSPDSSLACKTLRDAGLHDAFDEGGRGYGYTYGHFLLQHRLPWLHISWMRIDHIMLSAQLTARRCWTGTDKASEHRPVIADLVLRASDLDNESHK